MMGPMGSIIRGTSVKKPLCGRVKVNFSKVPERECFKEKSMEAVCFLMPESRNQLSITPLYLLVWLKSPTNSGVVDMDPISVGGMCGKLPPL